MAGVDWGTYELCAPGLRVPFNEQPPDEARTAYQQHLDGAAKRERQLAGLLAGHGIALAGDDTTLDQVDRWLMDHVETAPSPHYGGRETLTPEWTSVAYDVGTYAGNVLIGRVPHLHWKFVTDKRAIDFQTPVIAGFTNVPNKKFWISVVTAVRGHASRAGLRLPEEPNLVSILRTAQIQA